MLGRSFLMEYRTSWKGMFIFLVSMLFLFCITVGVFPQMKTAWVEELEGADNVDLQMPENGTGNMNLSWQSISDAAVYIVTEDDSSYMTTPISIYTVNGTSLIIPHDFEEVRYYAVLVVLNETMENLTDRYSGLDRETIIAMAMGNGTLNPVLVGMSSTGVKDSSSEMLKSTVYKGFTGDGRVTSLSDIRGFFSIMVFSLWFLPVGIFVGYKTANSLTSDFKEKRIDLILSTPLTRQQYIIEKVAAWALFTILFVIIVTLGLILTVNFIGMSSDVTPATLFIVTLSSIPLFFVLISAAVLSSIHFMNRKGAIGIVFLVAFGSTAIRQVASIVDSLEWMKYICLETYWDLSLIFYEEVFNAADFIAVLLFSMLVLAGAIILFKKKDIPA